MSQSIVSMSTKLSVVAVLGSATILLLPQRAASLIGGVAPSQPPAAIELVPTRAVPLREAVPGDPVIELAARRRRSKREPEVEPPEAERGVKEPGHKLSAISPATPPPPAPSPSRTSAIPPERAPAPDNEPVEAPKPDEWSQAQVIAALRECVRLLGPIAAEVEVAEPVKREQCGAPSPVMLRRIGSGPNKVEINPPAMLNCAMVARLHAWVETTLQPAAKEALGSPVTRLRNASGYVCRNRVGSLFGAGRLSEHALANAIDISGFVTADGRTLDVAGFWGPTARDEREAAHKVADAKSKGAAPSAKEADKAKTAAAEHAVDHKVSAISGEAGKVRSGAVPVMTADLKKGAASAPDAAAQARAAIAAKREEAARSAEGRFLRRLHKGACGTFGTVLGPEANEAHRDHFHFDLAQRRSSALCQ